MLIILSFTQKTPQIYGSSISGPPPISSKNLPCNSAEVQSLKGKNLYLIKGPSSEHDEARGQKHDHVTTKLYFVTLTQVILQLMTLFIDNHCQSLAFL